MHPLLIFIAEAHIFFLALQNSFSQKSGRRAGEIGNLFDLSDFFIALTYYDSRIEDASSFDIYCCSSYFFLSSSELFFPELRSESW
jgi:hypothetical protein